MALIAPPPGTFALLEQPGNAVSVAVVERDTRQVGSGPEVGIRECFHHAARWFDPQIELLKTSLYGVCPSARW
jgi:hypothetical protein